MAFNDLCYNRIVEYILGNSLTLMDLASTVINTNCS
jgi:hypothetical protein